MRQPRRQPMMPNTGIRRACSLPLYPPLVHPTCLLLQNPHASNSVGVLANRVEQQPRPRKASFHAVRSRCHSAGTSRLPFTSDYDIPELLAAVTRLQYAHHINMAVAPLLRLLSSDFRKNSSRLKSPRTYGDSIPILY